MSRACTPSARAFGLVAALLGGVTPAVAVAAPGSGPEASPGDPGRARAVADLQARRFAAAAAGFEALIAAGGEPGDREQAAEARMSAGHLFHAIEHWRAILSQEPGPSATRRAAIDRRVAAARRRTTGLRVRVLVGSPAGPVTLRDARVSLQRLDADDPRPPVEVGAEAGRVVDLDAGVWSLIARGPAYGEVQRVLTLAAPSGERAAEITTIELQLPARERPVVLALGPPGALAAGATWTLTPASGGEPRVVAADATVELSLGPGRWRVRAEAPGFVAHERTWSAGEAMPAITLVPAEVEPPAAPPPVGPPPPDPRLGLGLGLGMAAAVSLGIGVGLLVQHRQRYAHFESAPNNAGFVASLTASNSGSGLVGAGLGLAAVALTTGGVRGWVVGERGLWAELAVGGGVALIGSAWYAREWQRVQKDLYDGRDSGDPEMDGASIGHDVKAQRRETAAAAVIGAGAGLMIGAAVAVVTRTLVRLRGPASARARTITGGPMLSLSGGAQVGLGLRGRF